jgi:hypothetical protein
MTTTKAEAALAAFQSDPDFQALLPDVQTVALEAFLFDLQLREAKRLAKAAKRLASIEPKVLA